MNTHTPKRMRWKVEIRYFQDPVGAQCYSKRTFKTRRDAREWLRDAKERDLQLRGRVVKWEG